MEREKLYLSGRNIVIFFYFCDAGPGERIDIPDESNKKRLLCCVVRYKRAALFFSQTFFLSSHITVVERNNNQWDGMVLNGAYHIREPSEIMDEIMLLERV